MGRYISTFLLDLLALILLLVTYLIIEATRFEIKERLRNAGRSRIKTQSKLRHLLLYVSLIVL